MVSQSILFRVAVVVTSLSLGLGCASENFETEESGLKLELPPISVEPIDPIDLCLNALPETEPLYRYRHIGAEPGAFQDIEEGAVFAEALDGTVLLRRVGNAFSTDFVLGEPVGYVYPSDSIARPDGTTPLYWFSMAGRVGLLTTDAEAGLFYPQTEILGYVPEDQATGIALAVDSCFPEPHWIAGVMSEQPPDMVPLFAFGDVDEDGILDWTDVELLDAALSEGLEVPCLAAADFDRDGEITAEDLDGLIDLVAEAEELTAPALTWDPNLACGYGDLRVVADPSVAPGGEARVFLMDGTWPEEVEAYVVSGEAELAHSEDAAGYVVRVPAEADEDVVLSLAFADGAERYYTIALRDEGIDVVFDGGEIQGPPPMIPPIALQDCPQRGNGCEALVLDYAKAVWHEFDVERVSKRFPKVGCKVDYQAPSYKTPPEKITLGGGYFTITLTPTAAAIKRVNDHNNAEDAKINKVIADYRKRAAGKELAIELINAHGTATMVGPIGPGGFSRSTFHTDIYKSIKHQVCGHVVADLSCKSGRTPRRIAELENGGQGKNKTLHAGYDFNIASATATQNASCDDWDVSTFRTKWARMLATEQVAQVGRPANQPVADYRRFMRAFEADAKGAASYYVDQGYHACTGTHASHW